MKQTAQERCQRSTDHHEVKVSHDEVSVVQVNVNRQGSQEQTGQTTDTEQEDK